MRCLIMEKLTKVEKMLIKSLVIDEKNRLELNNAKIESRSVKTGSDLLTYAENQSFINEYNKILRKLDR